MVFITLCSLMLYETKNGKRRKRSVKMDEMLYHVKKDNPGFRKDIQEIATRCLEHKRWKA